MKQTFLRLRQRCLVFPAGCLLQLNAEPGMDYFLGVATRGWLLPDDGTGAKSVIPSGFADIVEHIPAAETPYTGPCRLSRVDNAYPDFYKNRDERDQAIGSVQPTDVTFIQYSDPPGQQLRVFLPRGRFDFQPKTLRLLNRLTEETLLETPAAGYLSSPVQLLFDTLDLPPGFYALEIEWPDTWTHELRFIKLFEGFRFDETPAPTAEAMQGAHPADYLLNPQLHQPSPAARLADAMSKVFTETEEPASVPDEQERLFNRALALKTEWGPNFGKPIHERLIAEFPSVTMDEAEYLSRQSGQVASLAYKLCEEVRDGSLPEASVGLRLREAYPWIDEKNIRFLISTGTYYSMR